MAIEKIDYQAYQNLVKEIEDLSRRKNADYGCQSLTRYGNMGILVRMSDKFDRLQVLFNNGQNNQVRDEKITDTLMDIVNYSLYMILQERGQLIDKHGK